MAKCYSLNKFAEQTGYGRSTIYKLHKRWLNDPIFMKSNLFGNDLWDDNHLRNKNMVSLYRDNLMFKIIAHNHLLLSAEVAAIMAADECCIKTDINGKAMNVHHRSVIRAFYVNKIKKIRIRLISSKRNCPEDIERRRLYC
jgi:hypothetical protein